MRAATACLACGGDQHEWWATARDVEYCSTAENFDYRRCARCQALFIDPVPVDRLAEIYPRNYYSFLGFGKASPMSRIKAWLDRRVFRRILAELPGDTLRVLDVGGGTGWLLSEIRNLDPRVQLTQVVDIDAEAASRARALGHRYFVGRIEEFTTETRYDLILLLNIIEHVEDPGAVMRSVAALLQPGGRALVKTPNTDALDARLFRHRNWGGYHCPRHWVLFDRASFSRIVAASGLSTQRFSYTQGGPFWAVAVLSWFAARGLASVSRERPAFFHPLFPLITMVFAAFDFARIALGQRASQMFFEVGRAGQ